MNYSILHARLSKSRRPFFLKFWLGMMALVMVSWSGEVKGQTTIFTESMGTVSSNTTIANHEAANGFDNDAFTMTDGGAVNPADIRSTSISSGYTGASGGANVFFTGTAGDRGFAIEGINASGYENLKLQFGYRKENASALPSLAVSYWDGTTYQNVSFTFNQANNASTGWYLSPEISLPIEAQINGLRIRFIKSGEVAVRIDDIRLVGSVPVTAPTTQASSLTFSNIEQNNLTVNWTNGDGAKRIVVMNTSNSFTNPADGTDPIANTVYNGSGEQVVFNGVGSSVAVTGLNAST